MQGARASGAERHPPFRSHPVEVTDTSNTASHSRPLSQHPRARIASRAPRGANIHTHTYSHDATHPTQQRGRRGEREWRGCGARSARIFQHTAAPPTERRSGGGCHPRARACPGLDSRADRPAAPLYGRGSRFPRRRPAEFSSSGLSRARLLIAPAGLIGRLGEGAPAERTGGTEGPAGGRELPRASGPGGRGSGARAPDNTSAAGWKVRARARAAPRDDYTARARAAAGERARV